jgi:hypothetical protein
MADDQEEVAAIQAADHAATALVRAQQAVYDRRQASTDALQDLSEATAFTVYAEDDFDHKFPRTLKDLLAEYGIE